MAIRVALLQQGAEGVPQFVPAAVRDRDVDVHADPALADAVTLPPAPIPDAPVIGLHISARKPSQRWPVERFALYASEPTARGVRYRELGGWPLLAGLRRAAGDGGRLSVPAPR